MFRPPARTHITAVRFSSRGTIVTRRYHLVILNNDATIGPSEAGRTLGNLCSDIQVSSLFAFSYQSIFSPLSLSSISTHSRVVKRVPQATHFRLRWTSFPSPLHLLSMTLVTASLHFGQFIPSTSSVDPLHQPANECTCSTPHQNSQC